MTNTTEALTTETPLATLTGSPKQVTWAEQIRDRVLGQIDWAEEEARKDPHPRPERQAERLARYAAIRQAARSQTSAKLWIQSRDWDLRRLGEEFSK